MPQYFITTSVKYQNILFVIVAVFPLLAFGSLVNIYPKKKIYFCLWNQKVKNRKLYLSRCHDNRILICKHLYMTWWILPNKSTSTLVDIWCIYLCLAFWWKLRKIWQGFLCDWNCLQHCEIKWKIYQKNKNMVENPSHTSLNPSYSQKSSPNIYGFSNCVKLNANSHMCKNISQNNVENIYFFPCHRDSKSFNSGKSSNNSFPLKNFFP